MKFLYMVMTVAFLDTFIQLPIITRYAIELGASEWMSGFIVAIYSLTNISGNIIAGYWIDYFGRKPLLVMGLSSVSLILLGYPIVQNALQLLMIRGLHGLAGGILVPATFTLIGDYTRLRKDGRTMAFTGATIGLSAIIGPAFGGMMAARAQIEAVFYLVAGLFVLTALISIYAIKETNSKSIQEQVKLKDLAKLLTNHSLIQATVAAFALMVSNGTLSFALPIQVKTLGYTTSTTGALLSLFASVAFIIFLTPLNKIYAKQSSIKLINIGLALILISLWYLNMMTSIYLAILAMIIYGIGFALVFPSMNQFVTFITNKEERGRAYGIFYAAFSLGVVTGSSMSGLMTQWFGQLYLFSGMMLISSIVCIIYLERPKPLKDRLYAKL